MIMKKLLVILLLFFPVHGAWAKTPLDLTCTYKNTDGGTTNIYFTIDFDNNKILNSRGIPFDNVGINKQIFQFEAMKSLYIKIPEIKNLTYQIDRATGKIEMTTTLSTGKASSINGICKKTSGKKKF